MAQSNGDELAKYLLANYSLSAGEANHLAHFIEQYRKQHELEARERLLEEIISKGKSTFAKKKEWGDLKYIKVETIKTFITDAELSELKAEREAL